MHLFWDRVGVFVACVGQGMKILLITGLEEGTLRCQINGGGGKFLKIVINEGVKINGGKGIF